MFDAGWNSTRITVWGVSTLSELSKRGIGTSPYDFTTRISDSIHEAIRPEIAWYEFGVIRTCSTA